MSKLLGCVWAALFLASTAGETASAAGVLTGIDVLAAQDFAPLHGLKIGLITNHTGTDRQRDSTIDLLYCAPGVHLQALFSPEHGIRGAVDRDVSDGVDERTGLPVYSLYGERRAPNPEQLSDLDALVFDIQDVGCRFYTYISTMGNCLEAAAQARIPFFVLDRPNPINGVDVEGPVLDAERSFTAFHEIPVRHGMTVGELARMFVAERQWHVDLVVIAMQNWTRQLWFDETGLPWINPSPNMRSVTEAALYPGVGLLEMTHLSVGRGTDRPFEVIGAPYINDLALASELNRLALRGVRFVPIQFTPQSSVFNGKLCGGVSILLVDRAHCRVVDIGIAVAQTLHRLYPAEFGLELFNRLLGSPATLQEIKDGQGLAEICASWNAGLDQFASRRERFLLYH